MDKRVIEGWNRAFSDVLGGSGAGGIEGGPAATTRSPAAATAALGGQKSVTWAASRRPAAPEDATGNAAGGFERAGEKKREDDDEWASLLEQIREIKPAEPDEGARAGASSTDANDGPDAEIAAEAPPPPQRDDWDLMLERIHEIKGDDDPRGGGAPSKQARRPTGGGAARRRSSLSWSNNTHDTETTADASSMTHSSNSIDATALLHDGSTAAAVDASLSTLSSNSTTPFYDGSRPRPREEEGATRRGSLDDELDSFLRDFGSGNEGEGCSIIDGPTSSENTIPPIPPCEEISLRELIERFHPVASNGKEITREVVLEYVKGVALPVARKLTEVLIEEAEHVNLDGIDAGNVMVGVRGIGIEEVRLARCSGVDPNAGTVASRLYSLGRILCELFSCERMHLGEGRDGFPSVTAVNLNAGGDDGDESRRKKSQRFGTDENDAHSRAIAKMERRGVPHSVRALVRNLLDCGRGDLHGDDAYASLEDASFDLRLMTEDPARRVDDVVTSPLPAALAVPDKLYAREVEIERIERAHRRHLSGGCCGVAITGRAGEGKSRLAMHVRELSARADAGRFLAAKFHQNEDLRPLSTVGTLFDSLCEEFVLDSSPHQLRSARGALKAALGNQTSLLMGVVPSLTKLLPSTFSDVGESPSTSANAAASMQFLFGELLSVISSYGQVTLLMDDLQWADPLSLLVVKGLIARSEGKNSLFFALCHRDSEDSDFNLWLSSISTFSLETIEVKHMTPEGVNELVSDTLRLSPRLTRPLSSVLHHKTRGNALHLRQLLSSLKNQGLIYVDLSRPRWAWDLEKIADLKISDTVLTLLIEEIQKLDPELRLGLSVASCLGSSVRRNILDIISNDLGMDLEEILRRASQQGYMDAVGDTFCFAHDKIEEAAYNMMDEQRRRMYHLRFGLAICSFNFDSGGEDDEMFFTAMNHINKGGVDLCDSARRSMVAALNLKAGRRAAALSDYNAALKLFEHGISFLESDRWATQYSLSLELFDAASEAACLTNKSDEVKFYTSQVSVHATSPDDKLNSMYAATKTLSYTGINEEALDLSFNILEQMGEPPLRPVGDPQLAGEMQSMIGILRQTTNETILGMGECKEGRIVTLMKVYVHLLTMLHFCRQTLIAAASLRLVELTFKHGLSQASPMAIVHYAEMLSNMSHVDLALRLGKVALNLMENKVVTSRYKGSVLAVYQYIFWRNTPFQSMVDIHELGRKAGMQLGDPATSILNSSLSISTRFAAGLCLIDARRRIKELFLLTIRQKAPFSTDGLALCYVHFSALVEGKQMLDAEHIDNVPGKATIIERARQNGDAALLLSNLIYHVGRTVLFRDYDAASPGICASDMIFGKKIPLRLGFLFALFLEGLALFQFARQTTGVEALKWTKKGLLILEKMRAWSERCPHNFRNKCFLLEAEFMFVSGNFERAESLYLSSVRSAIEHKFKHEEAIASELAGLFLYGRGLREGAHALLVHSAKCFGQWGAKAVARRVERSIRAMYGPDFAPLGADENSLESILSGGGAPSKKRGASG